MSHPLDAWHGVMQTSMGKAFPGQRAVFRGKNLHTDLKDIDWIALFAYGITGKQYSPAQLRLLHVIYTCTSYPDPRLWNNRIGALAASARSSSTLGMAAGLAATEATIYGWGTVVAIADFLLRAQQKLEQGEQLADIVQTELALHKYIKGYGRPMATLDQDERLPVILRTLDEGNLQERKYIQLALAIEQCLIKMGKALRCNYAPPMAAALLDLGFSLREVQLYIFPALMAGTPPGIVEALARPEGAAFPLKCEQIVYQGPPARKWE